MRLKSTSPMINGTTKKNRGDENMGIIRQHHYETDLNKPLTRHNVGVLLAEGDSGGDTFSVSVMNNGVAENLKDDVSVVAQFIRSDGNTVVMEGVNLLHSAQVTLLDACYVCEGRFTLTIKVTSYGTTTTVAIIDGMIRRTTTDTLVDPEEKIVNITAMQEMLEEAEAAAERAEAAANRAESGGGGGGGGGGIVTETDPTVPAWAKAASKPTYSKSEVGLGNVDNVKQYSASNPPPFPVKSVAGKTGAVTLGKLTIKGAASGSYNGSGDVTITIPTIAGEPGEDGYTPVKGTDYYTAADKEEFLSEMDAVRYVDQTLTEEQKAQARANIGATGNKWSGKVASFLGDSITRGMNTEKTYHEYLRELVGFSACNSYGISGSTISNYYETMCNRVDGIDNQSDIIFVFGGTNDFQQNIPMGEWYTLSGTTRTVNYDKTTFRGALTTLCEALLTKFPNKRNVLITPLHRYTYPGDYTELQANSQGLYLEDYVNAIKEAGKIYSIPVIDLYSESGLCPMNAKSAATYFHSSDKLHPNATGHRVIADVIMGFLDRTYPMYSVPTPTPSYTNFVPIAEERTITGDALTAYDGVGYATNYRLSSSGVIKKQDMAIATGFMPVSGGDTIRIGGIQWTLAGGAYNYMCAYKSDSTFIGAVYGSEAGTYGTKIHASCTIDYDAPLTTVKLVDNADIAFIRISCYNATTQDGKNLIVTINEEIT